MAESIREALSHVWLIGMMGSGKTSVGKLVADELKWRFLDVDRLIEEMEGRGIGEIFRQSGEPAFRRRERQALAAAGRSREPSVISTGGGAVLDAANVQTMRETGRVVWLRTGPRALSRRLAQQTAGRPLIRGAASDGERTSRLATILKLREAAYRDASHLVIDTDRLTIRQVAQKVAAVSNRSVVPVRTPEGRYDVHVGSGVFQRAGDIIRAAVGGSLAFIVTDVNVGTLFSSALATSLRSSGYRVRTLMLPAGERYKTLASVQRIWRWLFANGVDRSSPVVCLGGGVVGDLGGFAAATALRGIPVVQVATTLVAQVDSAIGGKTGFNTPEGKNLIGGFYPPSVVLVDPELLRSLPPRELTAGMGEVVKYAAIADAALFARLEAQGSGIFSDIGLLVEAIRRCIQIKAAVVGKDPKEYGLRVILNFGHTVGHALEAASRYRLLHGEAVAIGMAVETSLAVSRGLCSEKDRRRLVALLDTLGLPTQSRSELSASRFLRLDKKRAGTTVRIPLLRRIGRVEVGHVELAVISRFL